MALFYSTIFLLFLPKIINKLITRQRSISQVIRIYFFCVEKSGYLTLIINHCRSPPLVNLIFKIFKLIGGIYMTGNHPKRRKDKLNPYTICEQDGKYYIAFQDGQSVLHEMEIKKELYDTFNRFELEDLSHLNVVDRHLEQSEVWESTLNVRAVYQPESVEDIVFRNIQLEDLHRAIRKLPDIQRRRLILYYFEDMTYEQIAEREGCTKMPVKRSIDKAVVQLKKYLKKYRE